MLSAVQAAKNPTLTSPTTNMERRITDPLGAVFDAVPALISISMTMKRTNDLDDEWSNVALTSF